MEFILLFIGMIAGAGITFIFLKERIVGTLRIDDSDAEGPYLFLELNDRLNTIVTRKTVRLKVNCKNYIAHK